MVPFSIPTSEFTQMILHYLRNTYGLSLAELAKILNMNTRGSLYDWENKRSFPSMENLIFLTNFFGVSLEWLLG